MKPLRPFLIILAALSPLAAQADIYRWDNGALIPGTEGIVPGPAAQFDDLSLHYANLRSLDLTDSSFANADLTKVRFQQSTLTNASFAGATVEWANLRTTNGFQSEQLYSTASYQSKTLTGLSLSGNLSGWDFRNQSLAHAGFSDAVVNGANFSNSDLTSGSIGHATAIAAVFSNANLSEAFLADSDFSHASFRNANLTQATISSSNLSEADFTGATIAGAILSSSNLSTKQLYATASYESKDLRNVMLMDTDMSGIDFNNQDLRGAYFNGADLTAAIFDGADVRNATFRNATGLTASQLSSTRSYQDRDLTGVDLSGIDVSGWDLSHRDVSNSYFYKSNLSGADFSGSVVNGANFQESNLTKEQLYSTANYESGDLSRISLSGLNLDGADLRGKGLAGSTFNAAKLNGADLSNANISGARFNNTTSSGLTREQLYSTATYQTGNLRGVSLSENDLRNWEFQGLDLTDAAFSRSLLAGARFDDALISGASFFGANGLTEQMLQSTASYRDRDLREIALGLNYLSGWNFRDQDLTGASFLFATLTGADFTNALVSGANFEQSVSYGFTKEQLYSTASYLAHDLRAISLDRNSLNGWNFRDQYLAAAEFNNTTVAGADFSGADTRGMNGQLYSLARFTGATTTNMIFPDATIRGLHLSAGDALRIRDFDPPLSLTNFPSQITAFSEFLIDPSAALKLEFEADDWNSTIAFQPNIPVQLGGTLQLTFAPGVDLLSQVGRTFQAFNWTGVSPTGTFSIASIYPWDVSQLYTTGHVTLLLPGDTNGDHTVNLEDLNAVRNNFGGTGDGDTNHDGIVDLVDLNNVRNFFGATTSQTVPEPTSIALAASGVGLVLLARRQRRTRASLQCQEPIVDAPSGIH